MSMKDWKQIGLRLPAEEYEKMRERSFKERVPMAELARRFVREGLEHSGKKEKEERGG